MKKILKK